MRRITDLRKTSSTTKALRAS